MNNGFESGVYMRHNIDNYYNLPEAVIFVQADGCGVDMNTILPRVTTNHGDEAGGFLPLVSESYGATTFDVGRKENEWKRAGVKFRAISTNLFEGFSH